MRKPRNTSTKVDLTVPLHIDHATEADDCIGAEYDPQNKDCSICADIELCGIRFQMLVQSKKNIFEVNHGPLLDETDFKSVDYSKIERLVKKYKDAGDDPISMDELCDLVGEMARTKDRVAIVNNIKRALPNTKLIIKDGYVYYGENTNS